jgi:hypothetical protein
VCVTNHDGSLEATGRWPGKREVSDLRVGIRHLGEEAERLLQVLMKLLELGVFPA